MNRRSILFALACLCTSSTYCQVPVDSNETRTYLITNYGAVADDKTLNTVAIQKALNDCHEHGGGTVVIPPGNFVTGTLKIYSNMNLFFEPGSVLVGSINNGDYLYQKDFGFSGIGAGNKTGLLVAHHEQNIQITGFGTMDGNGTSSMLMDSLQFGMDFKPEFTRQKNDYMNPKYGRADGPVLWKGSYEERPGVMVIFSDCKNVTLSNMHFANSPNWTIAFLNSETIKINRVTIRNNMQIPNSDGIDLYDSKNITISDCDIQAGDDAIAVISSNNLTANNCILHSRSSGIRIGYNVYNHNHTGDLLFNNITIYDSNRGIGIFQRQPGDIENILFSNMVISTRLHSGQWWGHGEPIHISSVPGLGNTQTGSISHIRFSNISASSESGILIYASSKGLINDIRFDKVSVSIKQSPLADGYGGNFDLRPTNDVRLGIFKHSIPAFYSYQADDLSIKDMNVHWGKGLPSYFTHSIECTNFDMITIDGLSEQTEDNNHAARPTVYLDGGKKSNVKEISSTDSGKKLVSIVIH